MPKPIVITEVIGGETVRVTFVSSGAAVSPITSMLIDGAEVVVNTATPISSGNGHYFALHAIPNTRGWFVNRWAGVINANTYTARQFIKAVLPEVD